MGHAVHLFSPETCGFHIDLVTGNVLAPLSMWVSSRRSLDPSQNNTLRMISFAFFYMTTHKEALLFPVCFFQVKPCSKIDWKLFLASLKHPFSLSDHQISNWKVFSADKNETHVVWQISKKTHIFFVLLAYHHWMLGVLGTDLFSYINYLIKAGSLQVFSFLWTCPTCFNQDSHFASSSS